MKLIEYFRSEPNQYTRVSVNGKIKREGKGISVFYLPLRTNIEVVSITSRDLPFVFREYTQDNQEVSLQGGIVYNVADPKALIEQYNFSIDPASKLYSSDDPEKLPEQIVQLVHRQAKKIVQNTPLENILRMSEELSTTMQSDLTQSPTLQQLGIGLTTLYVTDIRPKPEITKGLEAEYRESLLQKEDHAIYQRRAIAVEKERAIQENEMSTQIELEQQRKKLVELKAENNLRESEVTAETTRQQLEAYKDIDSSHLAALGIFEFGKNVQRIETLTITPEILAGLGAALRK